MKIQLHLVDEIKEDWRRLYKWGSVQFAAGTAMLWAIMPEVANQWPQAAPFILHYFPKAGENVAPFIGSLLFILARVSRLEFIRKDKDGEQ